MISIYIYNEIKQKQSIYIIIIIIIMATREIIIETLKELKESKQPVILVSAFIRLVFSKVVERTGKVPHITNLYLYLRSLEMAGIIKTKTNIQGKRIIDIENSMI